ncbi:MAG: DUF2796 domain-containing protein [Gammaproteobacteria bacterium]|nr:DUF2796 domain-containing protein [Gammaproteobacteria bacterium]
MFTSERLWIGALLPLALLGLAPSQAASVDEARRAHEPHEHGAAELHVVLEGKLLHLELHVPAMSVVGFEHEARDDGQRRAMAAVAATLERADEVFAPTPQAGCRVLHAHAGFESLEHGHAQLHAEYELECASPGRLAEIRVRLFELFPNIERIDAEIIGSGGQTAATLSSGSPIMSMPR